MSASSEPARRTLVADSGVPACEVIVLDGRFAPVAQGVGKVEARLLPGLYKVRYKIGGTVVDESKVIELEPGDDPLVLPVPHLSVKTARPTRHPGSPAPDIATKMSLHVDKAVGAGAEIFVFVRDSTEGSTGVAPTGLELVDREGVQVADLTDAHGEAACSGCTLALNPGSYLLRLKRTDGPPLEQCIHLSEGWQTQVFLESQRVDPASPPEIDLSDAAILMSPLGKGFNPDDDALLWTDAARQALASARRSAPLQRLRHVRQRYRELQSSGISTPDLVQMLRKEFPNPMHGIHSGHLLLQSPNHDAALLRDVTEILRLQVGDHPDVMALSAADPAAAVTFRTPPMMRSSWRLVVRSTATRHDLVPPDSYAAAIGNRLWGSGAWLVWRKPEAVLAVEDKPLPDVPVSLLLVYVRMQLHTRTPDQFLGELAQSKRFTAMELTLLSYVARLLSQLDAARAFTASADQQAWYGSVLHTVRRLAPDTFASTVEKATRSTVDNTLNAAELVSQIGLPYAAVAATARTIVRKLNLQSDHAVFTRLTTSVSTWTSSVRTYLHRHNG